MPDVDLDGVSTLVFSLGMIYLELFGQNASFDFDIGVCLE